MSKLGVSTIVLQEMVSKVAKGVGNNKLLPVTGLLCIKHADGKLTLVSTDATNYLYVTEPGVAADADFYAVIDADTFIRLVGKLTCDQTVLSVDNNVLCVKANGTYKIPLQLDSEGGIVKYPDPVADTAHLVPDEVVPMETSTVDVLQTSIKPALAMTYDNPCYTAYYAADRVLATDTYKLACYHKQIAFDEPVLLSAQYVRLLDVADTDLALERYGNTLVARTDTVTVYGTVADGIEDYAVTAINRLVESDMPYKCRLSKDAVLQVLDRIGIFVGPYDKGTVYLTFNKSAVDITSKTSSGVDTVEYVAESDCDVYTCAVDIKMLTDEVKAIPSEYFEVQFGTTGAIKLVDADSDLTLVVALMQD